MASSNCFSSTKNLILDRIKDSDDNFHDVLSLPTYTVPLKLKK